MMIEPLYFPYTHIPAGHGKRILAVFERIAVLSPIDSGNRSDPPGLNRVVPVSGDETRLKAFLAEYRHFVAVNREKASAFLMDSGDKPFYDPTWASGIRSEIMRRVDGTAMPSDSDNTHAQRLLWARAFLQIAHEYDEENQAIDFELEAMARREKQLLENLLGGEDDEFSDVSPPSDASAGPGPETRIGFRLAAWATLFAHGFDADKAGAGFFLTHSPEVIEHLREYVQPFHHVCDLDLSTGSGSLNDRIHHLITTGDVGERVEESVHDRSAGGLSLYIAPDLSPHEFFARFMGNPSESGSVESKIRHTLIGHINIQK